MTRREKRAVWKKARDRVRLGGNREMKQIEDEERSLRNDCVPR